MKKIVLVGFLILISFKLAFAEEEIIAHGENPKGKSYFPYLGIVPKKSVGWQDSSITDGIFEVVVSNGVLDVRYVDSAKRIKSSIADGGQVSILFKGDNEVSVIVHYPKNGIEVYTFYVDKDGNKKFILTQARGGENVPITQSSIYTSSCDFIYFDKFPE
jgi:hypothetical protein